jgi:hypothetical protein
MSPSAGALGRPNHADRQSRLRVIVVECCGIIAADVRKLLKKLAGTTRLELATSAVTGQRSNQLNYVPSLFMGLVGNPHVYCVFLLSMDLPVSILSTEYIRFRIKLDSKWAVS